MAPTIRMSRSIGYSGINILIVRSLGKNPVSGGMPLIDRIIIGIYRNKFLCDEQVD